MPDSVSTLLQTNFAAHARERAYGQRQGYRMAWFTYGQVSDLAFRFVRQLEARQITKGDRVMLWGQNSAEWVATFFGCVISGVVVVPMDASALPDFVRKVSQQVESKLLVCGRTQQEQSSHSVRSSSDVLILEDLHHTLGSRPATPVLRASISPDDVLQIVFTSGATAEPKGVVITHGNVLSNVAPLESQIGPYLKYERLVHPV